MRWQTLLLSSPSLWNEIYVENGEDELAKVVIFLKLSKRMSLHLYIATVLPNTDSLKLIADDNSRVATVSIRPGSMKDGYIALRMEQWNQAASYIMAVLFYGVLQPSIMHSTCIGIILPENGHLYYHVVLLEFTMQIGMESISRNYTIAPMGSSDLQMYVYLWRRNVISIINRHTTQESNVSRTSSIDSIAVLASYVQLRNAIRAVIPAFTRLLNDNDPPVRVAAISTVNKLSEYGD